MLAHLVRMEPGGLRVLPVRLIRDQRGTDGYVYYKEKPDPDCPRVSVGPKGYQRLGRLPALHGYHAVDSAGRLRIHFTWNLLV